MANIIKVEFRVRGSKNNCLLFLQEDIHVADDINVVAENGTNEDYMIYAETECKWSVSGSLIEPEYGNSMQDISRKLGINIEIVGIDPYEPLGLEHYYYKRGELIHKFKLRSILFEFDFQDLPDEENKLYECIGEGAMGSIPVYGLKNEYAEPFYWDEKQRRLLVNHYMSFGELSGMESYSEEDLSSVPEVEILYAKDLFEKYCVDNDSDAEYGDLSSGEDYSGQDKVLVSLSCYTKKDVEKAIELLKKNHLYEVGLIGGSEEDEFDVWYEVFFMTKGESASNIESILYADDVWYEGGMEYEIMTKDLAPDEAWETMSALKEDKIDVQKRTFSCPEDQKSWYFT